MTRHTDTDDLATALASVQPRTFVALAGYPDDATAENPSHWHVNDAPRFSGGGQTTATVVLQAGDGSAEWVMATLERSGDATPLDVRGELTGAMETDDYMVRELRVVESAFAMSGDPDEAGTALDPSGVTVVGVADDQEGLP